MRDFVEAIETGDWDRFASLLAEGSGLWSRNLGKPTQGPDEPVRGRDKIVEVIKEVVAGLPEFKAPITREAALGSVIIHERLESLHL